jgi:nitroreductase/dihydropteridine reductase
MENVKTNIPGETILNALKWRSAVKVFDPTKKVSEEDMKTILEAARLSPSSQGYEMWKFLVIKDPEVRKKLREVGFDQPKITEASHLIVITYRTDADNQARELVERTAKIQNKKIEDLAKYREYLESVINRSKEKEGEFAFLPWSKAMTYIPLGIMILTASLLGIDNGPMEGFQPDKVDEVLGLKEKNLKSTTMLALGYRGDDARAKEPKVRRDWDDAIEII